MKNNAFRSNVTEESPLAERSAPVLTGKSRSLAQVVVMNPVEFRFCLKSTLVVAAAFATPVQSD